MSQKKYRLSTEEREGMAERIAAASLRRPSAFSLCTVPFWTRTACYLCGSK